VVGQIVRNRHVVHNAWSVAGTRIPTEAIWNFHQAGYSAKTIIREYPRLKAKDVVAAIKFEAKRKAPKMELPLGTIRQERTAQKRINAARAASL
jgi:uncharacterized protein (DUF433 family)